MSARARRYEARQRVNRSSDQVPVVPAVASSSLVPVPVLKKGLVYVPVLKKGPVQSIKMPPSFRIKYAKFRGDGVQDVDDWLEQYLAILSANDEGDEDTTKRLFCGLLEGEALRWYGALDRAVKDDWPTLKAAFEQEFQRDWSRLKGDVKD